MLVVVNYIYKLHIYKLYIMNYFLYNWFKYKLYINNYMNINDKKHILGQYYTTNPEYIFQNMIYSQTSKI